MPEELANQTPPPAADSAPPPVAPEAAAPPEAPAKSPFQQKLESLGFESVASDEEGFNRLAEAYTRQQSAQEEIQAQIREALAQLKNTPQTTTPPQTQAAGDGWWNPPAVDEALVSRFRTPDGGWKEGTPPEIRGQAEALEAYRTKFATDLVANPKKALMPLLQEAFGELFQTQFTQIQQQQQERAYFEKALKENDWLWQKDPRTQQVTQHFSEEGARFNDTMAEFELSGMPKVKAFEAALRIRNLERAAAQSHNPQQAQAAAEQKKQELLNLAAPGLSRNGSLPKPGAEPPRNRNLRFGERVLQNMQAAGPSSQ